MPGSGKNFKIRRVAFVRRKQFSQTRAVAFNSKISTAGATCRWVSTNESFLKAQKCESYHSEIQRLRTIIRKILMHR